MKKQLLFLLGMLAVTVILAQNTKTDNKTISSIDTIHQGALSGDNGLTRCSKPITSDEFNKLLKDIKAKGTESNMFSFAKLTIRDKCLLASQVEEIMLVFMFDETRSSFLKYAKTYTYDSDNYYKLRIKYQSSGKSKNKI